MIKNHKKEYSKYKKRYLELKYNYDGQLTKKLENKKQYNRATLILIEESYDNNTGRNEPTIILFADKKWHTYIEPGGKIEIKGNDIDTILIETIKRELREESLNTLNVTDTVIKNSKYVDYFDTRTQLYTRAFVIAIKSNQYKTEIYDNNKNILSQRKIPFHWQETVDTDRFYINDIIKCIKNIGGDYLKHNHIQCNSVDGNQHHIYNRTIGIINTLIKANILDCIINKAKDTKIINFNIDHVSHAYPKFLIGTNTIEIY